MRTELDSLALRSKAAWLRATCFARRTCVQLLLVVVTACAAARPVARSEPTVEHTETAPSAEAPPAPVSPPRETDGEPSAPPIPAFCFLARRPSPPGSFSNCFDTEAACRDFVTSRASGYAEMGAVFEVECVLADAPFCAVATDATGAITSRSCAIDARVCDEQRIRVVEAIRRGLIAGDEPTCRPATAVDLARGGPRAPGLIGP